MRKTILVLVLLLYGLSSKAQSNLDSLYSVWQDQTQTDTLRFEAYADFIWNGFLFSDPDSAAVLADDMIENGVKKNIPKAQASGHNMKGIAFYLRGAYPEALNAYSEGLKIHKELENKQGISDMLGNIGMIFANQGHYPKALDYYTQSLKVVEQLGNQKGIATMMNNIGIIYLDQGDDDKALDYFTKSLKIREELGDKSGSAGALHNIGMIYADQGDDLKGFDHYTQSLEIYKQLGNQRGIALALNSIGSRYYEKADYVKALDFYTQSLNIREKIGNQSGTAGSLNNIGTIYSDQGEFAKALEFCLKSYDLAVSIDVLDIQADACQCLYDTYKAMGNGNLALKYHELLQSIGDSLNLEETAKKLQHMEFAKQVLADSLATAEEARLVEEAHEEEVRQKNKTRNMLAGGGILVLLLAGGLFARVRYIRKSKANLQIEKDRSENLLLNILPADIAAELKEKGKADARDFEKVSILFTDFKGFTAASEKLSAQDLVAEINTCFEVFDEIMGKYGIEKIKTIGDAYMAAGGLPVPTEDSVKNTVSAALEMQEFVTKRKTELDALGQPAFEMRVGVHTGPVVAGIVGVKKFQYDIWGDTVNTASRMESSGAVDKVNISQATYEILKHESNFSFESRGKIEAKGKGEIEMYFVNRKSIS